MGNALRDFAPQIIALLAGGLVSSLGLTFGARAGRAQASLGRLGATRFVLACVIIFAVGVGGAFLQVRRALAMDTLGLEALEPVGLLLFGLLIGLPLSLPGVVLAWSDARARARAATKRRDFVPTKDDRRAFASGLARQIEEVSPEPRGIRASVGGDGDRVLLLDGDIDVTEGEKLTAALRAELSELGFKRVEGTNGSSAWWTRV